MFLDLAVYAYFAHFEQSATYAGFLYFTCAAVTFVSGMSIFCIPETKNRALEDLIASGDADAILTVEKNEKDKCIAE